jgi:site-specific DNA-methyltransferase (adenine-specific)
MPQNTLYYGDNLDILRRYIADGSVDLYLDPPFNSQQDYNVLSAKRSGERAAAQIQAFEDTWRWDEGPPPRPSRRRSREAAGSPTRCGRCGPSSATPTCSPTSRMTAPRLRELHRVLKPTGNIYLHCQILTVGELLAGRRVDRPPTHADVTSKRVPKAKGREQQSRLDLG